MKSFQHKNLSYESLYCQIYGACTVIYTHHTSSQFFFRPPLSPPPPALPPPLSLPPHPPSLSPARLIDHFSLVLLLSGEEVQVSFWRDHLPCSRLHLEPHLECLLLDALQHVSLLLRQIVSALLLANSLVEELHIVVESEVHEK